jgi:hypothetical protein
MLTILVGFVNEIIVGGEALVACGLTETLLNVVATHELPIEHISFVTRSVRVIDIVTALDVTSFHAASGMQTTIGRLVVSFLQLIMFSCIFKAFCVAPLLKHFIPKEPYEIMEG